MVGVPRRAGAQVTIPPPRGLVNDFRGVLTAERVAEIEAIAGEVRSKSSGEIAVVTLADIAGRAPGDVATADRARVEGGPAGGDRRPDAQHGHRDPARDQGVERRRPGRVYIGTGLGTEGFLTDAEAGSGAGTRRCHCCGRRTTAGAGADDASRGRALRAGVRLALEGVAPAEAARAPPRYRYEQARRVAAAGSTRSWGSCSSSSC
jgi:hypothetical protein